MGRVFKKQIHRVEDEIENQIYLRIKFDPICKHPGKKLRRLVWAVSWWVGMKTVRIFFDRIRDRIRLERFRSVRIRVRMFNIRYRIHIWILKSYIYDVDIQSYLIRHDCHYPYSNPNPIRNMKTNMISVISVRIRCVFIPSGEWWLQGAHHLKTGFDHPRPFQDFLARNSSNLNL